MNYGTTLMTIMVPDRDNLLQDIVLGFQTLEEYESDFHCIGAVVGRVAGHISYGKFVMDRKEYEFGLNALSHHVNNGGVRGNLSKKLWNYELLDNGNGVCFSRTNDDDEEEYPGQVHLEVTFFNILTNHNEILIDYRASTDKTTILNLANNAYFNLVGEGFSSLKYHKIQLDTPKYIPVDEIGFPTGILEDVAESHFNFLHERDISEMIDNNDNQLILDHDFCFGNDELDKSKFQRIVRLTSTSSGISMTASTTYPCVHVSMAAKLGGLRGKREHFYDRYSAISLQCRSLSDAINQFSIPIDHITAK